MNNSDIRVGILGTGSFLPEKKLTNFDLEKMVDTTDEWIKTRSGIECRRIADENTATSDLATEAGIRAIKDAGLTALDIDMIITATVTPDMAFPSTACIVQKNIGAVNASAFDISSACTGFIYGMTIAEKFIATGSNKYILVIGAETMSKILDYTDRNTCVLFGDGAGAAVIGQVGEGFGIKSTLIGADGTKGDTLTQPAGGSRNPATHETIDQRLHYLKMDGSEVFKFASRIMSEASEIAIEKAGLQKEDIDFLIPHQANIRIIDSAIKRLKMDREKVFVNLDKYGNISAASVPIALDEANKQGLLKNGENVLLVGFGAGLTWGSAVVTWGRGEI